MPTVTVKGLNVIAIYVADLERAKSFYINELGFVPSQEMPPGILLTAGDLTIYIEGGRTSKVDSYNAAELHPCFATDSVKASYLALKEKGVKIVTDYIEYAPTFALFRIADPDGNTIEFAGHP